MKVVLCGPPHSGKSCLREGLKDAMWEMPGAPYPYVITACPDGEGAWFQKTVRHDPALAAACKAAYKGKYTPGFVKRNADAVQNYSEPFALVDIGGLIDEKNKRICAGATHAILLACNRSKFQEWRDFCAELDLQIVAEIWSDYDGDTDSVRKDEDGLLTGSVHYLERGEPVADRPMIQALARHLVELVNTLECR